MRRYDKPLPAWQTKNKRGPGAKHPVYRQGQIDELRAQGEQLMFRKRELIKRIAEGNSTQQNTDKLEDEVAALQSEHETVERKIKKLYE